MGVWARGAEAGAGAALAALLLLLLLALLLRRRLRAHKAPPAAPLPRAPLVLLRALPHPLRRTPAPLATTPSPNATGVACSRRDDDSVQRGPPPATSAPPPPLPAPPAALPRLPLPEQWLLHKRPPDTQYAAAIARPLQYMLAAEPTPLHAAVSAGACTPRAKYSVTRSPSLEKDDRSPFVGKEVADGVRRPDRVFEFEETSSEGAVALRRYRSVSTRLDACGAADSPRYFTPPERPTEPAFFAEPEPKSVYYDTVRSPRFFADTPRTPVASPPLAKQRSPKPHGRNKENYFTFDTAALRTVSSTGGRPRRYGGRHSMDRERYTPPADHEPRVYRRHNSADTDIASHRLVLIETVPRIAPTPPTVTTPTGKNGQECDTHRARRQRIKSASLDSEYTPVGSIPAAPLTAPPYHKHIKEQLNLAQREHARAVLQHGPAPAPVPTSISSPVPASPGSPEALKRTLRPAADAHTFVDAPRFSPKELEITVTSEEGATCRATLPEHSDGDELTTSVAVSASTAAICSASAEDKAPRRGRNPRNLTIDLNRRDADLERELREFERLYSNRPRTPTLKVKATSLDSSEGGVPAAPSLHPPAPAAASVPNTPKRQPRRLLAVARRPPATTDVPPLLAVHYKQNLSVSSTNLKTLPEGVPSDDFSPGAEDGRARRLVRRDSHHALLPAPSPHASCASLGDVSAPVAAPTPSGSRNCLLQRRGSNHSLTLNIGGITAPHTPAPTPTPALGRSGLLERRASNTSLTLSMGLPQNVLATSVSQQELGVAPGATVVVRRGGILERRASNTSLTLSLGGESEPRALHPPPHHRKALSNENLAAHARPPAHPTYGSHGSLARRTPLTFVAGDRDDELIYAVGAPEEVAAATGAPGPGPGPTVISTRPLSPQSTSEEFRQYLANMQHLQTASSVLTRRQLRDLHDLFQHGYADAASAGTGECADGPEDQTAARQRALLRTLHREFWDMPSNLQEKPLVAGSHAKNRYRSILPNEHSRVRLTDDTDDGSEEDDEGPGLTAAPGPTTGPSTATAVDDPPEIYINANYIKGQEEGGPSYVATQGPLPNTIYDFWLMVHQQWARWSRAYPAAARRPAVAQRVVMLTELVEGGRAKCEPYFPLMVGERCVYRSECTPERAFTVTTLAVCERAGYVVRRIGLIHSRRRRPPVPVLHYWFRDWADHRCPGDAAALLRLALDLEPPVAEEDGPPAVVHCSAGVGRTGCLLAVLGGLRQLRRERRVDVLGIVCGLRLDRGGMLQTSEQYELVHRVLARYERDHLPPEPEPD